MAKDRSGQKAQTVPVVDLASWLLVSFKPSDLVVLKLDIEGAERAVVAAMLASGAARLVDVLLSVGECHIQSKDCIDMEARLRQTGPREIFHEPKGGGLEPWSEVLHRPRSMGNYGRSV